VQRCAFHTEQPPRDRQPRYAVELPDQDLSHDNGDITLSAEARVNRDPKRSGATIVSGMAVSLTATLSDKGRRASAGAIAA
jgi:hypothetical protein